MIILSDVPVHVCLALLLSDTVHKEKEHYSAACVEARSSPHRGRRQNSREKLRIRFIFSGYISTSSKPAPSPIFQYLPIIPSYCES